MIHIRPIQPADNQALAHLIRSVFREFGIDRPGTVYTDPTTDALYEMFQTPRSGYWVAEQDGKILGGAGIFPTAELPEGYAELVKLYIWPEERGQGLGKQLLVKCFETANQMGFTHLYLESLPELARAVHLYERLGFTRLSKPLGNSGHYACNVWMEGDLAEIIRLCRTH